MENPPGPSWKVLVGILIVLVAAVLLLFRNVRAPEPSPSASPSASVTATPTPSLSLEHRNTKYGFSIGLPESWRGYTVLNQQWEGRDVATGKVIARGPLIKLRNPLWTAAHPYEDMPVMVFTPAQWDLIDTEKMSVGAAPIPPSILGQNTKYILALPARYNYDFATGWEEVDRLVRQLQAFEPTP